MSTQTQLQTILDNPEVSTLTKDIAKKIAERFGGRLNYTIFTGQFGELHCEFKDYEVVCTDYSLCRERTSQPKIDVYPNRPELYKEKMVISVCHNDSWSDWTVDEFLDGKWEK